MNRTEIILGIAVTIFGVGIIYWLYSRHEANVSASEQARAQAAQQLLNPPATGANGNIIGNGLKGADNLATKVCPSVAKAYGGGALGGTLNTLCNDSRYLDPVHYIAQGLGGLINKI